MKRKSEFNEVEKVLAQPSNEPKKKTISLAMFTCYRVCTNDWVMVNIDADIEKFRNEYSEGFTNHHEIPNTRYEIEVDDD